MTFIRSGWGLAPELDQLVCAVAIGLYRRSSATAQGYGPALPRDGHSRWSDDFEVAADQDRAVGTDDDRAIGRVLLLVLIHGYYRSDWAGTEGRGEAAAILPPCLVRNSAGECAAVLSRIPA